MDREHDQVTAHDEEWLPALVTLDQCNGDWNVYVEVVYGCFKREFIDASPSFLGKRVSFFWGDRVLGKPATFWHLISEGPQEAHRLPEIRRTERIRWPRALIEAVGTGRVRWWRSPRPGQQRYLIALPDFTYVVVLEGRPEFLLLWTAYPVENQNRRRNLHGEHDIADEKG